MGPDYELKCLKCGSIIEHDDTYDSGCGENYFVNYCMGHCTKCDAQFQWREEFEIKFDGLEGFEEIS